MAWQKMPGLAKDIAIDGYGGIWVIGTNPVPGGFGIFFWRGDFWIPVTGGGMRIAVGTQPIVVNDVDDIFRYNGVGWEQFPGKGKDVSAERLYFGQYDAISVIGTNPVPGGFGIFEWNNRTKDWYERAGGAVAVSGGDASWVVNDNDDIFVRSGANGQGWDQVPGKAKDIGNYQSDTWVIGTNPVPGGFDILQWGDWTKAPDPPLLSWKQVAGGAVRIALGGDITDSTVFRGPCVVNNRDEIYRWV